MIQLYDHQLRFADIAARRPRFAWLADPGCGKTIGTLHVIAEQGGKTLILAPKSILKSAWLRDAQHFPSLRAVVITGSTPAKRREAIAQKWDIAITNYETFKTHAKDFLAASVVRLVVDESSKIKNHESQITKAAIAFADKMKSVYLLSGTPCPNNGTEIWAQLRCLSAEAAGPSYWAFANHFFTPIRRKIYIKGRPKEVTQGYNARRDRASQYEALLRSWSWGLRKADCLDLPAQTDIDIEAQLEPDQLEQYLRIKDEAKLELRGGEITSIKAAAVLGKLRQCTGGFVLGGGTATRVGDAKLEALDEILDSLGPDEPIVIWAEYRVEIAQIVSMIEQRGESVEAIFGDTSHDAAAIAERFQNGTTKRLVCHPASAGHGLTLTAACYAAYYSHSFSYEQYQQSRDRIHRIGQTRPVTYYHITVPGTVDEIVMKVLRRKGADAEAMAEILAETIAIGD